MFTLQGNFGPFEEKIEVKVPLWLAISLKQKEKCTIVVPDWLTVQYLREKVDEEKKSAEFQELHFHYIEVALMLFEW